MKKENTIVQAKVVDVQVMEAKEVKSEKKWKTVSEKEMCEYVENYPGELVRDVYAVYEPPLITYNDFRLGNWPESVVVSGFFYSDKPGDYYYEPEEKRTWRVLENLEELIK